MLPSRGLVKSNPASVLRSSCSGQTQPVRPLQVSIRHFSHAQSRSRLTSRARGASCASIYDARLPRLASIGVASSVFAQRSGASRNLSLWPFGSKKQSTLPETQASASTSPDTLETPVDEFKPPQEPVAEYQPPQEPIASDASSTSAPADISSTTTSTNPVDLGSAPYTDQSIDSFGLPSVLDIPEQIGYLKTLGLEFGFGPTSFAQWLLEHIYIYTGLPWWATISTVVILFRAALFRPTLAASKHQFLLAQVQQDPEFQKAKAAFDEAVYVTRDRPAQMAASQKLKMLTRKSGARFWTPFIGFIGLPFSLGVFRIFRAMAAIPVPSLETGGLAWFTDLTVPDPYYILPTVSVAMTVFVIRQMQAAQPTPPNAMGQTIQKGMLYFLPPAMFLGTAWLPAGLQWFFFMFSLTSIPQTWATLNPSTRRWAGLPPLPPPKPAGSIRAMKGQWQAPTARKVGIMDEYNQRAAYKKVEDFEKRRAEEERVKRQNRMKSMRQQKHSKRK
ncbi:60Kd inner membrane protein-domain-containing protein [Xylariaceae sp. FL0662B]|nr:60Kd inner membrane protein-domain-containing protein [Xylariaceae sp. FL0662B]